MQPAIGSALRTALKPIARRSCRFVGATRYPVSRRAFHRSATLYGLGEDEGVGDSKRLEGDGTTAKDTKEREIGDVEEDVAGNSSPIADAAATVVTPAMLGGKPNRQRNNGLPEMNIPNRFLNENVKLVESPTRSGSLTVCGTAHDMETAKDLCSVPVVDDAKYSINVNIYRETLSTFKAELAFRPPPNIEKNITRPVTVLHCPKNEGTLYLNSVVETVAEGLRADVIRLDAQDIAQIVGDYVGENLAWTASETSHLGYRANKAAGRMAKDKDGETNFEAYPGSIDESVSSMFSEIMGRSKEDTESTDERRGPSGRMPRLPMLRIVAKGDVGQSTPSKSNPQTWNNLKVSNALEGLVGAADFMRNRNAGIEGNGSKLDPSLPPRSLIIQVNDYNDLGRTKAGPSLLRTLRSIVDQHWRAGKNIILVGTESTTTNFEDQADIYETTESLAKEKDAEAETRVLIVPPGLPDPADMTKENDQTVEPLKADEDWRIRLINARHLEDMINKLSDGTPASKFGAEVSRVLLDSDVKFSTTFVPNGTVWPYNTVRKLATVILGLGAPPTGIDVGFITEAVKILNSTHYARLTWAFREGAKSDEHEPKAPSDAPRDAVLAIQAKCNSYEKKLLGGIRSPAELKTTFDDVHAPGETIETLKTLTSLSLQRPEAFSYGVLADNKIPGVLLYGPPGTGKTMLAKAVAKDGGATVLEVSGASVNDMYVGESEKNVRAIFTLAKKLSPCIVFIDEADALLGARSSGSAKRSGVHREIINQFLREWDGMSEQAAIIMVATNRPYDLDEAVLRRLPRRILVDLPLAADRERILHKHITGKELLASDVTPSAIAQRTPFYSGSDLKNVVVAAALECLREENAQAAAHTGPEPYVYPEKRVLHKRHFDKALDEISASISDDMATLKMIRQFDEKYGDRRGRKKKSAAMGFGGTTVEQEDAEAALVRTRKGRGKGVDEEEEDREKEVAG